MGCTTDASFEVVRSFLVRRARTLCDGEVASESTVQTRAPGA